MDLADIFQKGLWHAGHPMLLSSQWKVSKFRSRSIVLRYRYCCCKGYEGAKVMVWNIV